MAAIRSKDTKPELLVRRVAHALGYRFRLHRRDLPGKPDLVLPKHRAAIFVHGCYWHGHGCARGGSGSKSNGGYWGPKIAGNRARDDAAQSALTHLGWKVVVIWECETTDKSALATKLKEALRP